MAVAVKPSGKEGSDPRFEALVLAFQRWGFAGVANAAAVGSDVCTGWEAAGSGAFDSLSALTGSSATARLICSRLTESR